MHKGVFVVLFSLLISAVAVSEGAHRSSGSSGVSARLPGTAIAAMQRINPERIRAHVRFLSHDLLEGRGTGARGGDIAAEYMATQFALEGLKPAGDNGTYMQKVPLVGITPEPQTTFALRPCQPCGDQPETARSVRRLRPDSAAAIGRRCANRVCRLRNCRSGIQVG